MYLKNCKMLKIGEFLNENYTFYAHIDDNNKNKKKELLSEHIDRVKYYFDLIFQAKKLDKIFLNIENKFFENCSKNSRKLFREMLLNTIILHDIGKLNPLFQDLKMQNKIIKDDYTNDEYRYAIGSKHSKISSTVYIHYYCKKLKEEFRDLQLEEKKVLRFFIVLNSFIISRHHSDLGDFETYVNEINNLSCSAKDSIFNLEKLLKDKNIDLFKKDKFILGEKTLNRLKKDVRELLENATKEKSICIFTYYRLVYSVLVSCDYLATSEYISGVKSDSVGEIQDINEFYYIFKNTDINKKIDEYRKTKNLEKDINRDENKLDKVCKNDEKDINEFRTEIFIESENSLVENKNENIYYFEAPTGSGKTNSSINLSYKLIEINKNLNKIFYIYPFNTLIEQTSDSLKNTFGNNKAVYEKFAVINSIKPIKTYSPTNKNNEGTNEEFEYTDSDYQKFWLDKLFLNYPMVLTTNVSLFDIMFGSRRESCSGFYQLANSVVVLDEIQSYKITIWTEIITFFKTFADILNIKFIIMSATLPNLNFLLDGDIKTTSLIKNREKYFLNPKFKDRVKVSYELLNCEFNKDVLFEHVVKKMKLKKKILIEFITKKSAYEFYNRLKEEFPSEEGGCLIELLTGDDSIAERKRILNVVNSEKAEQNGIILVSTQVIEAGVDIDMDIGYKDVSTMDNEEQFMGRINRSGKRDGIVYFFKLDSIKDVYANDYRANTALTLLNEENRNILIDKNYSDYYKTVMELIKERNNELNENNIDDFFSKVGDLKSFEIEKRMKLIDDDNWSTTIYLCTKITLEDGTTIDGKEVWDNYKKLLCDNKMNYAKKQVKLSEIRSYMNYFTYQIVCSQIPCYNDMIGDIYCIYDGEEYFKDGKLNKDKFMNNIGEFI